VVVDIGDVVLSISSNTIDSSNAIDDGFIRSEATDGG
jgi:hypothetical protein